MEQADILIVDDMPENLHLLARMLKEKNYKVRALPSGSLALRSIESHPPDLILLDIRMPNMDGFEVCRRVKEMKNASKIPILFISANTDSDEIVKGFEAGAVDYITKPFHSAEVYQRIRTQLGLRNKEKELELLLSETVIGSIKAILDIMAFIDPDLYSKSNRYGRLMKKLVAVIGLDNAWMYETAALTANIGDVLTSGTVIQRHISELNTLKIDEHEADRNRQAAVDVIRNIPRMGSVAKMINGLDEVSKDMTFEDCSIEEKGALLLNIMNEHDILNQNPPAEISIEEAMLNEFGLHKDIVQKFLKIVDEENQAEEQLVTLKELKSGHIVAEDITSLDGVKLLGKGTLVTTNLKQILIRFSKQEGIHEPIKVKR